MFNVETIDNEIWITHQELNNPTKNRVASIIKEDKSDLWIIEINKEQSKFCISFCIKLFTQKEIIEFTKQIMLFANVEIYFQ